MYYPSLSEKKTVVLIFFTEFVYYLYCSTPWRFSNGWGTCYFQPDGTMGQLSRGRSEQWTLSPETISNRRHTITCFPKGREWMYMAKHSIRWQTHEDKSRQHFQNNGVHSAEEETEKLWRGVLCGCYTVFSVIVYSCSHQKGMLQWIESIRAVEVFQVFWIDFTEEFLMGFPEERASPLISQMTRWERTFVWGTKKYKY